MEAAGSAGSEAVEEPDVGVAAGFPYGEVPAVGRGDGPAQILFGFLEDGLSLATQVHAQERLNAGGRRGSDPDAAALGCPIQAGDGRPTLQRKNTLFAVGNAEEPDVCSSRKPLLLGHSQRGTIGRERPVVQIPFRAFDPVTGEKNLLASIEGK